MAKVEPLTAGQKIALITGASGGIGLRPGWRLFAQDIGCSAPAATSLPNEVRQGIRMLRCDVTDDKSVKLGDQGSRRALRSDRRAREQCGPELDRRREKSSVGGTGSIRYKRLRHSSNDERVLPIMRSQGKGRIINISSVAGFLPGPYTALYNASKHAVEGYSKSLDHELRLIRDPGFLGRARLHSHRAGGELRNSPIAFPASTTRAGQPRSLHGATASRRATRGSRGGQGRAGRHRKRAQHPVHAWKNGRPSSPHEALHSRKDLREEPSQADGPGRLMFRIGHLKCKTSHISVKVEPKNEILSVQVYAAARGLSGDHDRR